MFGARSIIFSRGALVTPDRFLQADLRISGNRITDLSERINAGKRDMVFSCENMLVYPGLINAHDHLDLNLFPRVGRGPYPNSYAWFDDVNRYYRNRLEVTDVLNVDIEHRLRWGGYRNLLSGATTVAHHNPYHRRVFESGFPVHVVRRYRWSHSLGLAGAYGGRPEEEIRRTGKNEPFILHLAEGTDETAAAELTRLDSMGALTPRTVIVHGVGLSSSDRALMASRNASMIWCPCSNMFLFNRTADIPALLEQRIPLALGTDSTLSGSATLFDELRFAHGLNLTDPGTLIRMVTIAAARILGLSGRAGCLAPGHTADLLILESRHPNPYINLLEAKPCDIVLVMKDGRPVYGDPASEILFQWTRSSFERISVEKKTRLVAGGCRRLLERLREYRGITLPIDVE